MAVLTPRERVRRGRLRRPVWWHELLLIGLSYGLYGVVRNQVPAHKTAPWTHATNVLSLERQLGINVELALNKAVAAVGWLAQFADYYYATMHFAVTVGVLVWLYFRRPLQYRGVRTVLYATNIVALVGFWLFPLAPPRLLAGNGFIDTVVVFHTWGSWGSNGVDSASNQFAAMPSLHIGWSLWCGITIVKLAPKLWVKIAGALYPVLTFLVIVVTANHYVIDAIGGAVTLGIGFAIQRLLSGRPAFSVEDPPPETITLTDERLPSYST